jgi:peptidyl-prolyl cis-trans isomerase SurA
MHYKKIITVFLIIILFIQTSSFAQDHQSVDKVVAVVGANIILQSDVESQVMQYKARKMFLTGDMKCKIFEDLLFQSLLLNQAELDSIEVSEKQVESELENRLKMFEDQMGGAEELEKYFNKTIPEIKNSFRETVHDQIMTQRMQGNITEGVKVSPAEVKSFFYQIPKDSIPVLESEFEISQIVLYPKIDDNQKQKIKDKLKDIRRRVTENKEDFATLAILYSEDPGSASKGGDLGYVNRGDMVPEFSSAAFRLRNPGEVSDVVESDFGYHIIQLIDRKGERINIRHILMKPKVPAQAKLEAKHRLDSIAAAIRKGDLKFTDAAKRFSEDPKSNKNGGIVINPYTGTSKFIANQIDPATNYAVKKLKIGEISDPFENQDYKGKTEMKIIVVNTKTEPHIASLITDYQRIANMALEHKKENVVSDWIVEKQKTTYIKIDDSYKRCEFRYKGWLSVSN